MIGISVRRAGSHQARILHSGYLLARSSTTTYTRPLFFSRLYNMTAASVGIKGKYPAKANARKVKEWIINKGGKPDGILYLEAQKEKMNEVCLNRKRKYYV
jgi:hypothetical protein